MFIDEAKIFLLAGKGGDGIISFHREKYNPKGGPDGGNGGKGGDVILKGNRNISTLLKFKNRVHFKAGDGGSGGPNKRRGKDGKDIIIAVPLGTVVKDAQTGEVLTDLAVPGAESVLAQGGKGGRGNAHFTSSTRQAPRICERGEPGEGRWVVLELKLLADVGIIGFPNVGKSTLISKISAQKPKIAPYPFTTLEPHLGVVRVGATYNQVTEFTAADIPGLIEGAHRGKGLGDRFLKHVERAKLLIHMVDISGVEGRDPLDDLEKVNHELEAFSRELAELPQIVVGNKIDLIGEGRIKEVEQYFQKKGVSLTPISAATGARVSRLVRLCQRKLEELKRQDELQKEKMGKQRRVYRLPEEPDLLVYKEGEGFIVEGEKVKHLSRLSLESRDALEYFYEQLERIGVLRELEQRGLKEGDRIRIGDQEFEYWRGKCCLTKVKSYAIF